jgi:hypothetical protein
MRDITCLFQVYLNMRKYLIKYLLESIVIITGISVSFWINQVSIDNDIKNERLRVLNNLFFEVQEIENYSNERLKIWNQDIEIYSNLLKEDLDTDAIESIAISKSRVEYNLIYYRDFSPPMNRYESMVNTGDLKYINSQEISDLLTRLHNQDFGLVKSTVEYEKSLKINLINLITSNYPRIILSGENNEVTLTKYLEELHKVFQRDKSLQTELLVQMRYYNTRIAALKYYLITLNDLKDVLKDKMRTN